MSLDLRIISCLSYYRPLRTLNLIGRKLRLEEYVHLDVCM